MIRAVFFAIVALALGSDVAAQPAPASRVGEVAQITINTTWQSENSRSKNSGSSRSTLQERLLSVEGNALILEYDLTDSTLRELEERLWQFPAVVRKVPGEAPILMNTDALQARSDAWLANSGLERENCGQWYFTWTAVKIECDPQSALELIADHDLWTGTLEPGSLRAFPGTLEPAPLLAVPASTGSTAVEVRYQIDPDTVRAAKIEEAIIVARILNNPLPDRETLTAEWAAKEISGSVVVTYELDSSGYPFRRTVLTTVRTETDNDVTLFTQTVVTEREVVAATNTQNDQ